MEKKAYNSSCSRPVIPCIAHRSRSCRSGSTPLESLAICLLLPLPYHTKSVAESGCQGRKQPATCLWGTSWDQQSMGLEMTILRSLACFQQNQPGNLVLSCQVKLLDFLLRLDLFFVQSWSLSLTSSISRGFLNLHWWPGLAGHDGWKGPAHSQH